ncbi:MAG: response regulator transcription factor, partial [Alistipes sp.]|nr:response regulator transcription factor [Alistipes sp.]
LPECVEAEDRAEEDVDVLTEREVAVLTAICQGLSTPQIADKLTISRRTVDAHRARILEKTGCNNTASLVAHAIKMNLVDI